MLSHFIANRLQMGADLIRKTFDEEHLFVTLSGIRESSFTQSSALQRFNLFTDSNPAGQPQNLKPPYEKVNLKFRMNKRAEGCAYFYQRHWNVLLSRPPILLSSANAAHNLPYVIFNHISYY